MRRKIEKAKKPAEKISNGDDILNEEINEYKVRFWFKCNVLLMCDCWLNTYIHMCETP